MTYTADKPPLPESTEELRKRIPGWGADLDPKDRPAVPREQPVLGTNGAHWDFPDRQPEHQPRERSIEHAFVTPVFGTAQPLKGLSGKLRRFAYARYSEGRAAHWLILISADRVDVLESIATSFAHGRPDNPITQTGILAEPGAKPISSRFGDRRADVNHLWIDPLKNGLPWALSGVLAFRGARWVVRRIRG